MTNLWHVLNKAAIKVTSGSSDCLVLAVQLHVQQYIVLFLATPNLSTIMLLECDV